MASMTWAYFWLLLSDAAKSNPVSNLLPLRVISASNLSSVYKLYRMCMILSFFYFSALNMAFVS